MYQGKMKQSASRLLRCAGVMTALFCAATTFAQKLEQSTKCNEDGTVTFYYENPNAKDVQVDVQFAGRNAMKKDANGVWTATLGPAAPDMYPYCFVVDGVSVMDPLCPQYFPNEGFKNSLLEIKDPKGGALAHDIKDVPHGKVDYIHYYSKSLGGTNNAIVYTPPTYDEQGNSDKQYPVFYLISGTTDTEEVYYKVGRMNYILDNLLAEGKAKDMIIVLPYGNPTKLLTKAPQGGMMGMGNVFGDDLIKDLMPYVESHYRTINDRDHRAIGGFSRGGNQGLSTGLTNLDKFSYLCSYSSFTSTDLPGVYGNAADTNSKIHLFWLGVGTDDFLYGTARDYMEHLDKKGIRSVKEYTHDKFGHTWMNAKYFLDKTLRLLFNPEASEEAMKNGQKALAKTGKEEAFTPQVMARLFPRQVVSPEFADDGIIFRISAANAQEVKLDAEGLGEKKMEKDADGVWSVKVAVKSPAPFKYRFLVDGTPVADPTNMYLSPDKGFKYSVLRNPADPYALSAMADVAHGRVTYDLNNGTASYFPEIKDASQGAPSFITLSPGEDDTVESWFKVGEADAVADKLMAEGKIRPCILISTPKAVKQVKSDKDTKIYTLKATDYKTWADRQQALVDLLLKIGK